MTSYSRQRSVRMLSAIVVLISSALLTGTDADVTVVNVAHNATVKLMCADTAGFVPTWFMNGSVVVGDDYSYSIDENSRVVTGTVMINGNRTCGIFNVYCRAHAHNGNLQNLYNTSLTVQGPLPSPEYVHVNELINSSTIIKWNPPYTALNNESDFVHVDPHIIKYTVYIIDNFTGNTTAKEDVTETQYIIRSNAAYNDSCPLYSVTAWNSGGEGRRSIPLPGYTPQIPSSIATANITLTAESEDLHISFLVIDPCTVRLPNSFLVTVITTADVNFSVQHHHMHQQGHPVSIRIRLPQNVDIILCNLTVRISAGNSAGMSSPTEFAVPAGCQTTDDTGVLFTASTTTATVPELPQESSTQLIIVIVGVVGGIVCVTLSVIVVVVCLWVLCARLKQSRKEKCEVVVHCNQAYETVKRMSNSRPLTKVPTEPCPAYGVVRAYQ